MTALAVRSLRPAALGGLALLAFSVGALAVSVAAGRGVAIATALTLAVALLLATHRVLARWHVLIGVVVLIIMFIPIKRYKIAAGLPFDLEPYRIVLFLVVSLWLAAALADPRVRLRRSFLDRPLLLVLGAVIGSILTNLDRIGATSYFIFEGSYFTRESLAGDVLKKVIFLASFFLLFYLVVSVVRSQQAIHRVVQVLVASASVVALFSLVQARTGYNVFDHVRSVLPILRFEGALAEAGIARGGRLRVYASAQHPIALAVMLVMVLPLALHLARHTGRKRWALAAGLIGLGAVSTVSRTSITTLVAAGLVFLWLRPRNVKRVLPLLLPALVAIHLVTPGAIGGLRQAFFPPQGLINDQTVYGGRVSSERLGPEWAAIGANPAFGQGYGTRLTEVGLRTNARILDDEWLGTASETGLVGVFAWLWFFVRFVRRAGREAKQDRSSRGSLLVALATSVAAFAVGMLTYDAFSFIQVTFVLFILAALGVCTLDTKGPWASERGTVVRAAARFRRPAGEHP